MKTIHKSLQIRTPIQTLVMSICILLMGNSLSASEVPNNEGEGPAPNTMEMQDFENNAVDGDLVLEAWMTAPFESALVESDLQLESDIQVEDWMTSPF